jgi:hypothetical protein
VSTESAAARSTEQVASSGDHLTMTRLKPGGLVHLVVEDFIRRNHVKSTLQDTTLVSVKPVMLVRNNHL